MSDANDTILHQADVEAVIDGRSAWAPYTDGFSASAANLAAIANAINTTDKVAGKMVWDTTNHVPMFAGGTTAAAHWYTLLGVDTITPA